MNTQDPYRHVSSMKRGTYPRYDDFVPYRNDWRYSVSFLSVLMVAAIVYGYAKLEPKQVKAVEGIAKSVTAMTKPVKDSMPKQAVTAQPTKLLPAATVKPDVAPTKKDVVAKSSSPSKAEEKPQPFTPVTGPPENK